MKILMFSALILAFASSSQTWGELRRYTAYVLDTSGSMTKHGFGEVKDAVLYDIKQIGGRDVGYIVPFAENEGKIMRVERKAKNSSGMASVESFLGSLTADGQYTNLDEGIDAAKLELMQETGEGIRTIVLISDGVSEPDAHHTQVKLEELVRRIPEGFRFYLVDLANNTYSGFSVRKVGRFSGLYRDDMNVTVFPLDKPSDIGELFRELREQDFGYENTVVENDTESMKHAESQWDFSTLKPHAIPLVLLTLVLVPMILVILKRRTGKHSPPMFERVEIDTEEDEEEPEELEKPEVSDIFYIKVGDVERRFGIPVTLSVGGGKGDDFMVKGAMSKELTIQVDNDGQRFRQRKDLMRSEKGRIFGSRAFSLRNGIPVSVKLESEGKTLHRYL